MPLPKTLNSLMPLMSTGLLMLSAPPCDLWPLSLVALVPLYLRARKTSALNAALIGWLAGSAAFMMGCRWWVVVLQDFAQLSEVAAFGVLTAFAIYQAMVFGVWAGGARLIVRLSGLSWLVVGPLWFAACEAALPFFLKMYLGITVWRAWPLTQVAEIGGPLAVSALVVLINLVLAEGVLTIWRRRAMEPALKWGALTVAVIIAVGGLRAWQVSQIAAAGEKIKIGLVQPNFGVLAQETRKHNGFKYVRTLQKANQALAARGAELIIWPESLWPYLMDRKMTRDFPDGHPWHLRAGHQGRLLLGALTHPFESATPRDPAVHNSAVLISKEGGFAGRYDKHRLLPFGEYIPWAEQYPETARSLRARMPQWPNIVAGSGSAVLADGDLRIGVMICSEDLQMGYAAGIARQNPNLLISMANDAWFGSGGAPVQHLALAVFRAIEARRDLVRCTNTGVSAMVDAVGRVRLRGPQVAVAPDTPEPPTLLSGEASLLDVFALGPYTAGVFPLACLLGLAGAVWVVRARQNVRLTTVTESEIEGL